MTYLAFRFLKLVGVALFFSGVLGTFSAKTSQERQRFARLHAAPGYMLSWMLGLALVQSTHQPLLSSWIIIASVASTLSLFAVLTQSEIAMSQSWRLGALAILGFVVSLAAMVFKPMVFTS